MLTFFLQSKSLFTLAVHFTQIAHDSNYNMTDYIYERELPFRLFVMPRPPFSFEIGREKGLCVLIPDNHVSSRHLRIEAKRDPYLDEYRLYVTILGRNGAYINGRFYDKESKCVLTYGDAISFCNFIICVCRYHLFIFAGENAPFGCTLKEVAPLTLLESVKPDNTVKRMFSPLPRSTPSIDYSPIEIEAAPARKNPEKQPLALAAGPALTMAVPILLGAGRKIMIIAGIIAAMWACLNVIYRRQKNKREEMLRRRTYAAYIKESEQAILLRIRNIRNLLFTVYPPLEEYLKGEGNVHLLWNRNSDDCDYGKVRVGIGEDNLPFEIKIPKEKFAVIDDSLSDLPSRLRGNFERIKDIPVCINIFEDGPFAIVTRTVKEWREILTALILRICVCYKPDELRLALLLSEGECIEDFAFLPHTWMEEVSLIAGERSHFVRVLEAISDVKDSGILAITDDREAYDNLVTRKHCTVIYLDNDYENIPPGMSTVLLESNGFSGILKLGVNRQRRDNVIFDRCSRNDLRPSVRQISSFFSHVYTGDMALPEKVLLTELIGEDNLNEEIIRRLWCECYESYSLSVPIGLTEGDKTVYLDADEKGSGPHGLIAGTTGSGKSELLQTLILSLAYYYPPWRVSFFLIDYKGGGMANMFENLPHLAGLVSNLSGAVTERAMISVKSENTLRQKIFAECGVNNIHDYETLYNRGEVSIPLPHIFIIVDEFAELKNEEPEFMHQLISVAQVGRSLGVHLILATQKPAGCIDDKIWSNSRFRICLKVRDKADSMDMLHTPDASHITNVGRAYMQVGNDEEYFQFQCAYTMAPIARKNSFVPFVLFDSDLEKASMPSSFCTVTDTDNGINDSRTQMDLLKELILKAYKMSDALPVRKLWLDELPCCLPAPDIRFGASGVAVGIYDDPENQQQHELFYSPVKWGSTMVVGLPGSGKSSFLLRILSCLAADGDTDSLAIYIIDFGGRMLLPIKQSSLCGGYISYDEWDNVSKMIGFIKDEAVKRRSEKGKSAGGTPKCKSAPDVIAVIDNFGSMVGAVGEEIIPDIIEVLRDGASLGIYFLISGNMISSGELPNKLAMLFDSAIALNQRDKYAYSGILSISPSHIPLVDSNPGRGLVKIGQKVYGFQTYTPAAIVEEKWADTITSVIEQANTALRGRCRQYPYVPKDPRFSDFAAQCAAGENELSTFEIPIGYESDSGHIYSLPISEFCICFIVGRRHSGRHNTLRVIEEAAKLKGLITTHVAEVFELSTLIEEGFEGAVFCESLSDMLTKFYESDYASAVEERIVKYFASASDASCKHELKLFSLMNVKDRNTFISRRIFTAMCEHPYVIALGGNVSEYPYFDFSYTPYLQSTKRKPALNGDVAYFDEDMFCGEIVIPQF